MKPGPTTCASIVKPDPTTCVSIVKLEPTTCVCCCLPSETYGRNGATPIFNFFFTELPVPPQAAGVVGTFNVLDIYPSEHYGISFFGPYGFIFWTLRIMCINSDARPTICVSIVNSGPTTCVSIVKPGPTSYVSIVKSGPTTCVSIVKHVSTTCVSLVKPGHTTLVSIVISHL